MKSNLKLMGVLLSSFLAACGDDNNNEDNNNDGDKSSPISNAKKLLVSVSISSQASAMAAGRPEVWTFRYDDRNRLVADNAWGDGNKIEYQDAFPSLRTRGENPPLPSTIAFIRYLYGEGDLNGVPTKYYQKQLLGSNGDLLGTADERFYLDANGRVISSGLAPNENAGSVSGEEFKPWPWSYTYDERGNLLRQDDGNSVHEFTYDDKKGKMSETTSPLWLFKDEVANFSRSSLNYILSQPNNLLSYIHTQRDSKNVFQMRTEETYSYTYDADGYPIQALVTYSVLTQENGTPTTYQYQQTYTYMPAHSLE